MKMYNSRIENTELRINPKYLLLIGCSVFWLFICIYQLAQLTKAIDNLSNIGKEVHETTKKLNSILVENYDRFGKATIPTR